MAVQERVQDQEVMVVVDRGPPFLLVFIQMEVMQVVQNQDLAVQIQVEQEGFLVILLQEFQIQVLLQVDL